MKRIFLAIALFILTVLCAGVFYQIIGGALDSNLRADESAPGRLLSIDGSQMHLHCTGQRDDNEPIIVFESGWSAWSTHWIKLQSLLQSEFRVCSYDRSGYGWSDAREDETPDEQTAIALNALLAEADEKAPYVLVGHSLGTVYARIFAGQFPDQVTGLVLLDAAPPGRYEDQPVGSREALQSYSSAMRALPMLTRLGVTRLTVDGQPAVQGYESAPRQTLKAFLSSMKVNQTASKEYFLFDPLVEQAEDKALGKDLSVLVINAANSYPDQPDLSEQMRVYGDWLADHLSDRGKHETIQNSDHFELIAHDIHVQMVAEKVTQFIVNLPEGSTHKS